MMISPYILHLVWLLPFNIGLMVDAQENICSPLTNIPSEIKIGEDTAIGTTVFTITMEFYVSILVSYDPPNTDEYFRPLSDMSYHNVSTIRNFDFESPVSEFIIVLNVNRESPAFRRKRLVQDPCYLRIIITDVNEAPQFPQDVEFMTIYEGLNFTQIPNVVQKIADPDVNDTLVYSLVPTTSDVSVFVVDPSTGALSYAASYDIDGNTMSDVATVYLEATDSGGLTDRVLLLLSVLNTNDNLPEFIVSDVTVYLSLLTPVGAIIQNMFAIDADGDPVDYSLSGQSLLDYFQVNSIGQILLQRELTADTPSPILFNVTASDGGKQRTTAAVTLNIIQSNSNSSLDANTLTGGNADNSCTVANATLNWLIPVVLVACTAAIIILIIIIRNKKKKAEDDNKVVPVAEAAIPEVA